MKQAAKSLGSNTTRSISQGAGSLRSLCDRRAAAIRTPFSEPVDVLLEDLSSGNAEIVAEDFCDDPTIPPPGHRSGSGSSTILPYLVRTLAAKPRDPVESDPAAHEHPRAPDAPARARHSSGD